MRKLLCILALTAAPVTAFAQHYTINGTAPDGVKKVYLQKLGQRGQADSTVVADGKFAFTGEADGNIFAYIVSDRGEGTGCVLDGTVSADLSSLTTGGTPENEGLNQWKQQIKPTQDHLRLLGGQYYAYYKNGQTMPDSVRAVWEADYEKTHADLLGLVKQCCQQNKDKKFPAYFLSQQASSMDKADVIALAEEGNPAYMDTRIMDRVKGQLTGWKRQMTGAQFTDLEMQDTEGQTHKLSEYVGKGKYVLVDFWASWCGPCRKEMPNVKKVYEAYKDKGFDIVGLSFDSDKAAWTGAIKSLGLPWHHLSDLKGWECVAGSTYGVNAIPHTLLIGPDGKIIASGLSGEEVAEKLAELIK